jgi:hypothetical protein
MSRLYIGFSKAKSKYAVVSKIIQKVQNTPFSHVYIRLQSDSLERTFIYQASGSKVNFENMDSFNSHSTVVNEFEIEASDEVYKKVMQFAIDTVGKPYSLKQLIGMAVLTVLRKFNKTAKNPYRDRKDAFICSEIGAYVLEQSGIEVNLDKDSIGPKEIFEILQYSESNG